MKADLHIAEHKRLAALRDYEILDTPREAEFDDIVRVASAICDAPISVINLIDEGRQWFKAEVGLGVRKTRSILQFARTQFYSPVFLSCRTRPSIEDLRTTIL